MLVDVAYVGNHADDLLLFANYNQAPPNNAAGHALAAGAPADPRVRRHHLRVQRRRSRATTPADEARVAAQAGLTLLELADAVEGEGQRRRLAREPERQLPGAAGLSTTSAPTTALSGYHQPYNSTTSFVWQLPFGKGRKLASHANGGSTPSPAAGRSPPSTHREPASRSRRHATRPPRPFQCRASRRTSAAPTTTAQRHVRPNRARAASAR